MHRRMRSFNDRTSMEEATIIVLLLLSIHVHRIHTAEIDMISDSRFLTESDTLVSPAGIFELGFFRPGNSDNKYVGIWYKKLSVQTVVWVANRNHPLSGESTGTLKIVSPGNLVLMNNTNDVIWSTNTTSTSSVNAIATLEDVGNLVVADGIINSKIIHWQSFDYPTDTLLPGQKYGRNFLTGKEWHLSSWKSDENPAVGEFTLSINTEGYPQSLLTQNSSVKFRIGPWNGVRFSGASSVFNRNIITTFMVINETEVTYTYLIPNSSVVSRLSLNSSGLLERWVWVPEGKKWQVFLQLPRDFCDVYNICNAYGTCSMLDSDRCSCLDEKRFVPRNQNGWDTADWSGGCVRKTRLDCENGTDGFVKYYDMKLPDTRGSWFNKSMDSKECEAKCLKNCSCMAYANTDVRGKGSGCLLWFTDLLDIRVVSDQGRDGQVVFVRMAFSELEKNRRANIKIILPIVLVGVLLVGLGSTWFYYAWRKKHHPQPTRKGELLHVSEIQRDAKELPLFTFSTIDKATDSFSPNNKIGEGGFGPVYKGILEESGIEIAVKRLSKTSSQGLEEFKNEVIFISKLQHRNLVKLLGCSIQGDEMLLIYEYMPNKSLDSYIFDKTRSMLLTWSTRFNIIKGIARGLLYLHQDSRLRIIHRDLKASNVLLDLDMNPKISDFGMARSFGGNETEANTERVVGTYGYMSPEYALDGVFSMKSDVFSFGVLVLEIVSGMRNRGFIHPEHDNNLIGHAWRMHNEGRSMELIDTTLSQSINSSEVIRSIIVGLLCVQQSPEDRPNMSSVVLMLGNEGALLEPKQPGFFVERILHDGNISASSCPTSSTNDLTVTEVVGR